MARIKAPKKRGDAKAKFEAKAKARARKNGAANLKHEKKQNLLRDERRIRRALAKEAGLREQNTGDGSSNVTHNSEITGFKCKKTKKKSRATRRLQAKRNRLGSYGPVQGPNGSLQEPKGQACRAVFDIPELAEIIFLELEMRDLLCGVIQTCKRWVAIVKGSVRLQQHLFFRPIPIAPLIYSPKLKGWVVPEDALKRQTVFEHPLLTKLNSLALGVHIDASLSGESQTNSQWMLKEFRRRNPEKRNAINRRRASWRRALLSQPPIGELHWERDGKSSMATQCKSGVRMRGMLHAVRSKRPDEIKFIEPALQLHGYAAMAHYKGYACLEGLIKAEKANQSEGK